MLVFLFAVCHGGLLFSQSTKASFIHKSMEDGLSNRFVNCIFQDSRGFIWVGTNNGLNRYDGYNFESLKKNSGGLSAPSVVDIEETFDGKLWVLESNTLGPFGKPNALDVVDPKTLRIISFDSIFGQKSPFGSAMVSAIASSTDAGSLYIGLVDGRLFRWSPTKKLVLLNSISEKSPIIRVTLQANGQILVLTHTDVYMFGNAGELLSQSNLPIQNRNLMPFGEDKNGKTWLFYTNYGFEGDPGRIYRYGGGIAFPAFFDLKTNLKPREVNFNYPQLGTVGWDPERELLWVEKQGHWIVSDTSGKVVYDFSEELEKMGIRSIYCIYIDHQGNTWLGTGDGIVVIRLFNSIFNLLLNNESDHIGKSTISTRGMFRIGDQLYVNSYDGGKVLDLKTGKKLPSGFPEWDKEFGLGMYRDSRGWLWSGMENSLFIGFKPNTKEFKKIVLGPEMRDRGVAVFHEMHPGKLLLGTLMGLAWYDIDKNKIELFDQYNQFPELSKSKIRSFFQTPDGELAIASSSGIYFLDKDKGIVKRWRSWTPWSVLLCDNINFVHLTKNGTWCIATLGCGLVLWDPYRGKVDRIELPSDIVYSIMEGTQNDLWFSTQKGLARLDIPSGEVRAVYTKEDGISHDEFNTYSFHQDTLGNIYLGGLDGVTYFNPKDFGHNQQAPAKYHAIPFIRFCKANAIDRSSGYHVDITPGSTMGNVIVQKTSQVGIELTFSLLCFQDPNRIIYRWRMMGWNDNWNYQSDNKVQFNNLSVGAYTLEILGRTSSGDWSEPLTILVVVEIPFYQSRWFYVILIGAGLLVAYLLFRWRVVTLERDRRMLESEVKKRTREIYTMVEQLEEMDQVKSNFFANITHELRTPLTLVLSPIGHLLKDSKYEISDEARVWLTKAARNGSKLNNLLNEMLELSKLESNKMTRKDTPVLLEPLLRRLFLAFQTLALSKDVRYEVTISLPDRISVNLDIPKIEKIINNLISNAIKYTHPKGSIVVKVNMEESMLICEVCDNGIGIPAKDLDKIFDRFYQSSNNAFSGGAGIGLALSRELTLFLGGDIKVVSEAGKGSCFTLKLPLVILDEPLSEEIAQETEDALLAAKVEPYFRRPVAAPNAPLLYIAEDQLDLQDYLWELLSPHYRLHIFSNGRQLLDYIEEKGAPDLIISDVMMPEMDGFEMVNLLKSHLRWWRIPVVMLTARNDLGDRLQALRIGVDDYLAKPFDPDELLSRCSNLLSNLTRRSEPEDSPVEGEADLGHSYDEPLPEMESTFHEWLFSVETQAKDSLERGLLSVSYLASRMFLSERQFGRRLKQATGLSPKDYVREVRLQTALTILQSGNITQAQQAAQAVGLNDWDYFVKQFKDRFGKHPSNYLK